MLDKIIDSNEKVLWEGKPHKLLYVIGSPFMYIFAAIWLLFDLTFIRLFTSNAMMGASPINGFSLKSFFSIFMILHLAPVWITLIGFLIRLFTVHRVNYMVTDKRIYLVSGLFGTDITNVEHKDVKNLNVNVNPIQNLLGVGTVRLTPDGIYSDGDHSRRVSGIKLLHVHDPYDAYKLIKRVAIDVSTDQQYPNAYRPDNNPGYTTKYDK